MRLRIIGILLAILIVIPLAAIRAAVDFGQPRGIVRDIAVEPKGLSIKLRDGVKRGIVLEVGKPFTLEKLHVSERLISSIPAVGRVVSGVDEDETGVRVRFSIQIRPVLEAIEVRGNRTISTGRIEGLLGVQVGDCWDGTLLESMSRKLDETLKDNGLLDGRVAIGVEKQDESGEKLRLVVTIEEGELWRISRLEFKGVRQYHEAALRKAIAINVGDPFSLVRMEAAVKKIQGLYMENHYDEVKVSFPAIKKEEATKTIAVFIVIEEGARIFFHSEGGGLSDAALLRIIHPGPDNKYSKWFVDESVETIRNTFVQRGYFHATVRAEVVEHKENGTIDVVFRIECGPRVYLRDIKFRNHIHFSDAKLQNMMYELLGMAYKRRPFREEDFQNAVKQIPNYYRQEGYLRTTIVSAELQFPGSKSEAQAEIVIDEGERVYLDTIRIAGNRNIDQEKIFRVMGMSVGKPIDYFEADRVKSRIQALYADNGYARAAIQVDLDLKYSLRGAALDVKISEGEQYHIGRILLSGNRYTDDDVILRELTMRSGDLYTPDAITENQAELQELGLFRSVVIRELLVSEETRPVIHLMIELRERPRFVIEVGPGYGTEDGVRMILDAKYLNIGGRGRKLTLHSKVNRKLETAHNPKEPLIDGDSESRPFVERDTTLAFFEPRLFKTKWDGRLALTELKKMSPLQDDRKMSTNVGMSRRLFKNLTGDLQYRVEFSNPFNVVKQPNIDSNVGHSKRLHSVFGGAEYLHVDDFFLPSAGYTNRSGLEVFSKFLGSDADFWKADIQNTIFLPLLKVIGRRSVFAISLRAGFSATYGDSEDVPIEKNYRLGGEMTVRGFGYQTINSKNYTGGDSYFNYRLEVNVPLISDLDLMVFQDAGNIYRFNRDFNPSDLRFSMGPGLRWNTPVGPLKAGVGLILNRREGESWGSFFFGVGPA